MEGIVDNINDSDDVRTKTIKLLAASKIKIYLNIFIKNKILMKGEIAKILQTNSFKYVGY